MARLSFALPAFDRCERPRTASVRAWRLQPGRFAQGPEEKCGTVGRVAGILAISSILPDRRPSVGRGVPPMGLRKGGAVVKPFAVRPRGHGASCRACTELMQQVG